MLLFVYVAVAIVTCVRGAVAPPTLPSPQGPIVETTYGTIEGSFETGENDAPYDVFLGLPYGAAPIDDLRFRKPQPPLAWSGVRSAKKYAPHCPQIDAPILPVMFGFPAETDEDCLHLNVFVPGSVAEAVNGVPLAVMVYVHGGAYNFGTPQLYPGEELALHGNVVVVTIAYRLGILGFLSTADAASPGNYALWDVNAALQWVQDNIYSFGGNANDVTLFGQSAGGTMVSNAVLSPTTAGLMHSAIAISGSATAPSGYTRLPRTSVQWMSDQFQCDTTSSFTIVDCLRLINVTELIFWSMIDPVIDHHSNFDWKPVIDGEYIVEDTWAASDAGAGRDIPYILGTTDDEMSSLVLQNSNGSPQNMTNGFAEDPAQLEFLWRVILGQLENVDEMVALIYAEYPGMNSPDAETRAIAATAALTDFDMKAGSYYEAENRVSPDPGPASTYMYRFQYSQSFLAYRDIWPLGYHTEDLYSVWGINYNKFFLRVHCDRQTFIPEDLTLSDGVMDYYTNFAWSANPNVGSAPIPWSEYDLTDRRLLIEGSPFSVVSETTAQRDHYDFWNYQYRAAEVYPEDVVDWTPAPASNSAWTEADLVAARRLALSLQLMDGLTWEIVEAGLRDQMEFGGNAADYWADIMGW